MYHLDEFFLPLPQGGLLSPRLLCFVRSLAPVRSSTGDVEFYRFRGLARIPPGFMFISVLLPKKNIQ